MIREIFVELSKVSLSVCCIFEAENEMFVEIFGKTMKLLIV
jgi:hypothetical protein